MARNERIFIIVALYLIVIAILLNSFKGRYQYCIGQNNIHGVDYLPKILDTWTGKTQSIF